MKVMINRTLALLQKTGIGHYTGQLIRCLTADPANNEVVLYPGAGTKLGVNAWTSLSRAVRKLLPAVKRGSKSGGGGNTNRGDWRYNLSRVLQDWHFRAFANGDFDVYHEPNYIAFPCSKPTVVTVHDLSLLLHPEWHPATRVKHFARNFLPSLERVAHVITISEFSRQEILRNLPLAAEQVSCIYLGVRPDLGPMVAWRVNPVLHRLGLPDSYLLHVGTLEPRKNLMLLLRAYTDLPAHVRERCPLVLAGGWGWNTQELAEFFHSEARHKGVLHLGYIRDEDQAAVYNGARALVFPSHYEGFGLPPIEMMACGGAVLASTAGAVVETTGGKAHLLDPLDQGVWREAMQRVILDDDWWQQLRHGVIELARHYTWERCAADTWQVYRRVLGGGAAKRAATRAA